MDTSCPICQQAPESILHTLRDCTVAANCWHNLGGDAVGVDFFSLTCVVGLKNIAVKMLFVGAIKWLGVKLLPLVFGFYGSIEIK